jgi:hypothetical protein
MAFHAVQISILNMKNINGGLAGEMRKTKPLHVALREIRRRDPIAQPPGV